VPVFAGVNVRVRLPLVAAMAVQAEADLLARQQRDYLELFGNSYTIAAPTIGRSRF
jgi:hypothetical protein